MSPVARPRSAGLLAARPGARGAVRPTFSFAAVLRFTAPGRCTAAELIGAEAVEEVWVPASEVRSAGPALRSWLAEHATGVQCRSERRYLC